MANRECNLTKQVLTPNGRRFRAATLASNGRVLFV
jgi:hypothetical protein